MDGWLETQTGFVVALLIAVLALNVVRERGRKARSETRREVQLALLSKFESSRDMLDFLASSEGARFLDELSERPNEPDPRQSALRLATFGCIGLGLTAARWWQYSTVGGTEAQSDLALYGGGTLGLFLASGACLLLARLFGIRRTARS